MLQYKNVKSLIENIFSYIETNQNGVNMFVDPSNLKQIMDYCINDLNLDCNIVSKQKSESYLLVIDPYFNICLYSNEDLPNIYLYDQTYFDFQIPTNYYVFLMKNEFITEEQCVLFDIDANI